MSTAQDPFNFSGMAANLAAPPAANASNQEFQNQYSQSHYQQQQPQQQYNPTQAFGAQQQQQLVVAKQPSNPYSGLVAPQQPPQQQQASPWDAPTGAASQFGSHPPTMAPTASANPFDPFATAPPAPASAPIVAPAPALPPQQQTFSAATTTPVQDPWATTAPVPVVTHTQAPPPQQQTYSAAPALPVQDPWATTAPSQVASTPQQQQYQPSVPTTEETQIVPAQAPKTYQNQGQQSSYTNGNSQSYGKDGNNRQIVPASKSGNVDDNYGNRDPRNPYSNVLAQQVAGSKASGLPKAELVGKKGFVLSRISFRTIVMKKWKQSFWVQYGGHTMLWFRSQGDFDDWLNNPYHTQMQRNFLIKLAINFVHDLYKPNVRGYQVTQCRTKPYGKNKVVRQFKLERWMDYGPTIAAAFGSFDPKEVDACREAIVECMKNTPLDNGIRATGAVKEHHDRQQQEEWRKSQEKRQAELSGNRGQHQNGGNGGYNNYSLGNNHGNGMNGNTLKSSRAMSVPEMDLLGDLTTGEIDDSASVPPGRSAPVSSGNLLGDVGGGALVPAVNPNAAYPGAPPAPVGNTASSAYYPGAPPQMQQPGYSTQPQAADPSPYGAQTGASATQGYPGNSQQHQHPYQQQPQYPVQAPVPAFAQTPQTGYGGHSYQQQSQMQQQPVGGYPTASYPVPAQQF